MEQTKKAIIRISNVGTVIGCVILFLIAIAIIFTAVVSIYKDATDGQFTVYKLLDEVGLIVFAIAVIDVAKYLLTEEVLKESDDRNPKEARRTLTKFAVIIATALSLEGLVLTIETAKNDVTQILYPMSLLLVSILFIIGIGIYQKLNASSES